MLLSIEYFFLWCDGDNGHKPICEQPSKRVNNIDTKIPASKQGVTMRKGKTSEKREVA